MNKFLTHEGGQPIWLEDIDFMQESVRDTFKVLLSSIVGEYENTEHPDHACILQGCETTDEGVSPGYIYYRGEILPFDGHPEPLSPGNNWLETYTVDRGDRILKNGVKVQCWQEKRVRIGQGYGDNVDYFNNLIHIRDLMAVPHTVGFSYGTGFAVSIIQTGRYYSVNGNIRTNTSFDVTIPLNRVVSRNAPAGTKYGIAISREGISLAKVVAEFNYTSAGKYELKLTLIPESDVENTYHFNI